MTLSTMLLGAAVELFAVLFELVGMGNGPFSAYTMPLNEHAASPLVSEVW